MWTVAFHPDGKHLLGGTDNGVQRWRLADGREVGRQIGTNIQVIAVTRDCQRTVCGTLDAGAAVWEGEMDKKVIHVEGTKRVYALDVSTDSTRFATGTFKAASIWSVTNGQQLVGPLRHDSLVTGIRFSPSGEHIATACFGHSIQIFDSHTGDKLLTVNTVIPQSLGTPLAWSGDGQQIFAVSRDNKIRSFNVSTGSLLAESQILHLHDGNDRSVRVRSIALAGNGKFIATSVAWYSLLFLDTSTLEQIGYAIEGSKKMWPLAISVDSSYLAVGQYDGKIVIRDIGKILPDSYGPFHVSQHNYGML